MDKIPKGIKGFQKGYKTEPWNKDFIGNEYKGHYKQGFKGIFKEHHVPWNKGLKGIHLNSETEFKKGIYQGFGFKKGFIPWNKNLKLSKEQYPKYGLRSHRLTQIFPLKDTEIEIKIQRKLTELNIQFVTHKSIIGQPDIFIEPNICIFIDGCWWHGCEQCFNRNKLSEWILKRKVSDELITLKLRKENYIVMRFWEHDINNAIENVINEIEPILALKVIQID